MSTAMEYRIGCSGYYYPQWKNKLYPKGVAPKKWLAYYGSVFNTVELNGTFYRQPKQADLKKYKSATEKDFTFAVKMSRYITHVQRMKDPQTIATFQDLIWSGLEEKVQHFLFQLPANHRYTEGNLETIIRTVPQDARNVIEFRHLSWWNETVYAAFKQANLTFCSVDFPGLDVPLVQTSHAYYLRLHGNPELFKSPYSAERLAHFAEQLPKTGRCSVYFNNTITEAGFENARMLMHLVRE